MRKAKRQKLLGLIITSVALCLVVGAQPQRGLEVQLAGIRLGSPVIDRDEGGSLKPNCLLRVWGMPDFIVMGLAQPAQPQMGAPGAPGMPGMPGAPMMPGGIGGGIGGAMGSGFGGQPTLPGVMAGAGMMGQLAGAPMGRPMMPMAGVPFGEMPGGIPGMEAGGMPGAPMMPGAGTAGAVAIFPQPSELAWAVPVFVSLQPNQSLWLYKKGDAALSFLVDEGNRVAAITVAGRRFDAARTALGDPFKTIKLGDDFQRVLLRYGHPDELIGFNAQTLQPTGGYMTRNMVLRYHRSSNVEFTVLDYKVVRIFIFLPEEVTLTR